MTRKCVVGVVSRRIMSKGIDRCLMRIYRILVNGRLIPTIKLIWLNEADVVYVVPRIEAVKIGQSM